MLSAGYQVTNWTAIENKKLDKSRKRRILDSDGKQKGDKKMKAFDLSNFDGRDGKTYSAGYYKRAEVWNVHEITRKIVVSCMASGVIGAKDSDSE